MPIVELHLASHIPRHDAAGRKEAQCYGVGELMLQTARVHPALCSTGATHGKDKNGPRGAHSAMEPAELPRVYSKRGTREVIIGPEGDLFPFVLSLPRSTRSAGRCAPSRAARRPSAPSAGRAPEAEHSSEPSAEPRGSRGLHRTGSVTSLPLQHHQHCHAFFLQRHQLGGLHAMQPALRLLGQPPLSLHIPHHHLPSRGARQRPRGVEVESRLGEVSHCTAKGLWGEQWWVSAGSPVCSLDVSFPPCLVVGPLPAHGHCE